ncbi:AAA family ATPase [Acinetobacter johnsonii]|uniref:Anticodon nuclease n=1 Tax=Acinetobacter johnsonii TaxID=40214 RepID=A0A3S9AGF2_ACIJO|nr:AAA family ATPase [Acinetobacter johnsonii]AZN62723.1 anticodon nuclease [Acinetobacter johnsonii]MDN5629537.1 AAA family ATPase [Lactococcus sp.]
MNQSIADIVEDLKTANKRVQVIYAFNGTGKTRLSRTFKESLDVEGNSDEDEGGISHLSSKNIIYYNAFTEDLFFWDNDLDNDEDRKLRIHPNAFTKWVLEEQGQGPTIIEHFQRLTNTNIEPQFSSDYSEVYFLLRGDEQFNRIKISKGEESNLIWCIFFSFLCLIEEELSSSEDQRSIEDFNSLKYVFIDDPVSSLDDNHLITLAVDLAKLIKSSSSGLKFIITTHNPLFFNVLSNEFNNKLAKDPNATLIEWAFKPGDALRFRLNKRFDGFFDLIPLGNKVPFSYHLQLLFEIREAIKSDSLRKYHFGFMRNILEKTATFLGYSDWNQLLPRAFDGNVDPFFNRILNLYSHSAHAGEETMVIEAEQKEKLQELVTFLSTTYGFKEQEEMSE